jgi:hypothetical protein
LVVRRSGFLIRARGRRDRFELSALNGSAAFVVVLVLEFAFWFVGVLGVWIVMAWCVLLLAALLSRRVLVVTCDDALLEIRFLGIVVKRRTLGVAPTVVNLSWDWDEVAIMPRDPAIRRGLEDDERAVIVESTDPKRARALAALVRTEIARLHARHLTPRACVYRENALPSSARAP